MQTISRENARNLIENEHDLTVIEVLPEDNYRKFHLPGAKNVPLDDDFEKRIQQIVPDESSPVLLYCMDAECEASTKAAARMEELGFTQIYDYEAGKIDWKEAGLRVEEYQSQST